MFIAIFSNSYSYADVNLFAYEHKEICRMKLEVKLCNSDTPPPADVLCV